MLLANRIQNLEYFRTDRNKGDSDLTGNNGDQWTLTSCAKNFDSLTLKFEELQKTDF